MGARLNEILEEVAAAGRRARRARLRRRAECYVRDGRALLHWTSPRSRAAVEGALAAPHDPRATRALCRALYRDWKAARTLPRHLAGRRLKGQELRVLLACECRLYGRQAASLRAQQGMGSFLRRLAGAAE